MVLVVPGSVRRVDYTADPVNGFNAVVSKSGPSLHQHGPPPVQVPQPAPVFKPVVVKPLVVPKPLVVKPVGVGKPLFVRPLQRPTLFVKPTLGAFQPVAKPYYGQYSL